MPFTRLSVTDFLARVRGGLPVLDVRSPAEYAHARLPGATSFPLFSDEKRAQIGTAYKQQSREEAVKIGLDAFGPSMRGMVEKAAAISEKSGSRELLVHCWRGGMRSEAVAWLLDFYGFEVALLEGGYKAFRNWVVAHWTAPRAFRVLGGYTGAGKTAVLRELARRGTPVLDLEGLARHKGSAFGNLERKESPSQEAFENEIAWQLEGLRLQHGEAPVWVEDESQRIGNLNIPFQLAAQLRDAPMVQLEVPFEERLKTILAGYGKHSTESLLGAVFRIKKRLGGLETKTAVNALIEGDLPGAFRVLLQYYDKLYRKAMAPRPEKNITLFDGAGGSPKSIATALLNQFT